MMNKHIVFTGGGSGGHVVPAIAMIKEFSKWQYEIFYIGSRTGIERELITGLGIPYYSIYTGKLRRYFSLKNFTDAFRIIIGFFQATLILCRFNSKNTVVFSTGGFVSVPVVLAAWIFRKKIFIHEQTSRIGLANKISSYFAYKIFVTFEESLHYFSKKKTILSGYPLRDTCFTDRVNEVIINNIKLNEISRPILFVTGGGNGSSVINNLVKNNLDQLIEKYFVLHQVGKAFVDQYLHLQGVNYQPVAYIGEEIIDIFKLASVVLSRAGAGTVCELLTLNKKSIFIPLKIAQKNEQKHNAEEAQKKLGSIIIEEDHLTELDLMELLNKLKSNFADEKCSNEQMLDARRIIFDQVDEFFNTLEFPF